MNSDVIQTITAAEHLFNLIGGIDGDVCCWRGGRITATIHLFDARLLTAVDDDISLDCVSGCLQVRIESRQITTAIDSLYMIGVVSSSFTI